MYNKLFTKILDSSIWLESTPTRIVWLTFIAVMDQAGFAQFASIANVAHRARVTPDEAAEAIRCLESPDPDSSNPEHEGRRIERVPGGWMVLNAEHHRKMVTAAVIREQTRVRVKRHRDGLKRTSNADVTPSEAIAEATTEAKAETTPVKNTGVRRVPVNDDDFGPWLSELRAAYPPKAMSSGYGTESAFASAVASHGTPAVTFGVMMLNLESQKAGAQWAGGKIPRLDRWLSLGLWEQQHEPASHSGTLKTAGNLAAARAFLAREGQ